MKFIQTIAILGFLSGSVNANSIGVRNTCGGKINESTQKYAVKQRAEVRCRAFPTDFLNADPTLAKDIKGVDCFDNTLVVQGCRNVEVDIEYKLCNREEERTLTLKPRPPTIGMEDQFWVKFNNVDVVDPFKVLPVEIEAKRCHNYFYTTTIDTCKTYSASLRMKLNPPNNEKDVIEGGRCNAEGIIKFVNSPGDLNDPKPDPTPKTKAPKKSKSPKASKNPKVSKDPKDTKSPKVSKDPKKSKSPKVSKDPKKSKSPKVSKDPKDTKSPKKSTKSPKVSKDPKDTKSPKKSTKSPKKSKSPKVKKTKKTKAPKGTKAPGL